MVTVSGGKEALKLLLASLEPPIRQAFYRYTAEAKAAIKKPHVKQLVASHNIDGITALLQPFVTHLTAALQQSFILSGKHMVASLGKQLGVKVLRKADLPDFDVTIDFDDQDAQAAAVMQNLQMQFVTDFTQKQKQVIRQALTSIFQQGGSTQDAVDALSNVIGLTPWQQAAVDNYQALLQQNSADALNRMLRDKRYDNTVEDAVGNDTPLTDDQISMMTDRYRSGMLNYRANTIARTESLTAMSTARHQAMGQVADQLGYDPDTIARTWNATHDKRTRETHCAMDGETVVGMNKLFKSPSGARLRYPGDPLAPAAERAQCRCVLTYDMSQAESL